MEKYKSRCPDCGARYEWTGFKTGIGKSEAQLQRMKRDRTVCRECGGENLETGLGDYPEMDSMIKGIFGGLNPKSEEPETKNLIIEATDIHPGLDWIQTFSGKKFSFTNPLPEQINIFDIAHALSQTCRYAGHTNQFYSVAQHSVLISHRVSPQYALWGLLHDAAEAYINDIPAPAKCLPELSGFKIIEDRILDVIIGKYDLGKEMPEEVKIADIRMLLAEKLALFDHHHAWELEKKFSPYDFDEFLCWDPRLAYQKFTQRFAELRGDE